MTNAEFKQKDNTGLILNEIENERFEIFGGSDEQKLEFKYDLERWKIKMWFIRQKQKYSESDNPLKQFMYEMILDNARIDSQDIEKILDRLREKHGVEFEASSGPGNGIIRIGASYEGVF